MNKWDERWLELAKFVSQWSKDPSTKVGAVIAKGKQLISLGYNGFPASCPDHEEWLNDRPTKYKLVTHAEVNAVFNSQQSVKGCTLYTYPLPPCATCASLLAAAGIEFVHSIYDPGATQTQQYLDFTDTKFVFETNGIFFICRNPSIP